jgi:pimeloyl-ACP methyl ester carboxylesterase
MSNEQPDNLGSDLRGAGRLVVDAVVEVTDLVESLHRTIVTVAGILPGEKQPRSGGLTGVAYDGVRKVTRMVGVSVDAALERLAARLDDWGPSSRRDIVVGAVNGVVGDYLAATNNPLAISMHLRWDGHRIRRVDDALRDAVRKANGRIVLMLHGSSATEHLWTRDGHNHGEALADELGVLPIHVRYNSGLHISENGAELSKMLETFIAEFDVPIELTLLAHSMGGLVARSAYRDGDQGGAAWPESVARLICLGTPHHGSHLERYGNHVDNLLELTPYSAPFARLGRIRSAGVTDLRYGNVSHKDWEGRDRFQMTADPRHPVPLPTGVDCYTIAATTRAETDDLSDDTHGDGLVPVDSALGRHDNPAFHLDFPDDHQWVMYGCFHLDLLGDPEVYDIVKGCFENEKQA